MNKISVLLAVLFTPLFAWPVQAAASAADELAYYKKTALVQEPSRREERSFSTTMAHRLSTWAEQNPQHAQAKEALFLAADQYTRASLHAQALITLFKIRFYYPDAEGITLLTPRIESVMKELDKRQTAQALSVLAVNTADLKRPQREAALLQSLVNLNSQRIFPQGAAEFEAFFLRNPSYTQNDKLELLYGDFLRLNGRPLAAVVQYKKVNTLYHNSPYQAASLRLAADVYADDLKNPTTATALYTAALQQYPGSSEEGVIYKHMGTLDENNKNYDSALLNYQKAAELLSGKEAAFEALIGRADVYEKTKNYPAALEALVVAADAFKQEDRKYVHTLQRAAKLAQRRLDDLHKKTVLLEKILLAYPTHAASTEILYDLGQTYEKMDKPIEAQAAYKRLILSNPTDSYASKAQRRMDKLGN